MTETGLVRSLLTKLGFHSPRTFEDGKVGGIIYTLILKPMSHYIVDKAWGLWGVR